MSFSMLIRQHFKAEPNKADSWETAFLELQVLLASCDGIVAPAERMTLSLLSLARRNEKENREIVDALLLAIQRKGFEESAARVLGDVKKLSAALPAAQRAAVSRDILRESVSIVLADNVVSDKERSFVVDKLAPELSIPKSQAREILDRAASRLDRSRLFVAYAFELYVMIIDAAERPPSLHAPPGKEMPDFLTAVDELVASQHLGSNRAVSYFVGAMAGMFWVDEARTHTASFARMAQESRSKASRSGIEARLGELHLELEGLAAKHAAPDPFATVTKHLTAALAKVEGLDPAQRARFREQVAPALRLDHDDLLKAAEQRRSLADLHRNLTATDLGACMSPEGDDPHKWWRFWH